MTTRNIEILPFRPCRGALGFFSPDFTVKAAPISAQAELL